MNPLGLNDATLFVQQAYIGGRWTDASGGQTLDVDNHTLAPS